MDMKRIVSRMGQAFVTFFAQRTNIYLFLFVLLCASASFSQYYQFIHENDHRRLAYVSEHPELQDEKKSCILAGEIDMNMTEKEVLASWGRPMDIHRTRTSAGVLEKWVYSRTIESESFPGKFLFFRDGILIMMNE